MGGGGQRLGFLPPGTYRPHDTDDALAQQAGVDVVGSLPPALRGAGGQRGP